MATQREIERNIVRRAKERGMSDDQIKQAVLKYRGEQPPEPEPEKDGVGIIGGLAKVGEAIGEFGKGAIKGIGSTLARGSELGERGLRAVTGTKGISEEPLGKKIAESEILKPEGTAQKVGFAAEQIGEFFIPGSAPLKAGKAVSGLKALSKAPKVVRGLAGLGTVAATESGLAAGQTAIQKGQFDEEAKTAAKFGAALPVAGKVAGKVLKGASKVTAQVLGKSTGAGTQAVEEAFKNPAVVQMMRQAGKQGADDFLEETVRIAGNGMRQLKKARGEAYRKTLASLDLAKKEIPNVLEDAQKAIAKNSNTLDTVIEGRNVVDKAIKDVAEWTDVSAEGIDKLKQRLGSYSQQLTAPGKSKAKFLVDDIRVTVKKGLEDNVEGYKNLTKPYEEATKLIDEMERALSLRKTNQIETAARKLMQTIRRDDDTRKELMRILGQSAGDDITARVSGAMLSPAMPRGLVGAITPTVGFGSGLALSALSPQVITSMIPIAMLSSPRLVGEFLGLLGKITPDMVQANKLSPQLQRAFRELMMEMKKDVDT